LEASQLRICKWYTIAQKTTCNVTYLELTLRSCNNASVKVPGNDHYVRTSTATKHTENLFCFCFFNSPFVGFRAPYSFCHTVGLRTWLDLLLGALYASQPKSSHCKSHGHGLAGFFQQQRTNKSQFLLSLETVYHSFDVLAKRRRIFKVETVGDCYVGKL
jgi:hypothetical protein